MNRNGVNSTVGLLKYLATALGSEGFGYGHHLVSYVHQKHTFTQMYTIFPVNQSYISATKSCYGNMEESEELGMVFKRVANKPNEFFRAIGFQADEKDQKNSGYQAGLSMRSISKITNACRKYMIIRSIIFTIKPGFLL